MRKLNLKKIITMGLITTSILAVVPVGVSATWREDSKGIYYDIANVSALDPSQDSGNRCKGWLNDYPLWFYFDSEGYMKKGWLQDGGKWYYFEQNGRMATRKSVNTDGYLSDFNTDGSWLNYTGGIKTAATSSNSSVDPYVESHPDWVSSINPIKAEEKRFERGDATGVLYAKYPESLPNGDVYTWSIDGYNKDIVLTDANGKYFIFPMQDYDTKEYLGVLKAYQNGNCVQLVPGEYTGMTASKEEALYFSAPVGTISTRNSYNNNTNTNNDGFVYDPTDLRTKEQQNNDYFNNQMRLSTEEKSK